VEKKQPRTGFGLLFTALVLVAALQTAAGARAGSAPVRSGETALEYRIIEEGKNAALQTEEPVVRAFTDRSEFLAFHKMITGTRMKASEPSETERLDFSRNVVVFFSFGRKRTGGYGIDVISVRKRERTALIRARLLEPPQGSFQIQALTHPYVILSIPGKDINRVELLDNAEYRAKTTIR